MPSYKSKNFEGYDVVESLEQLSYGQPNAGKHPLTPYIVPVPLNRSAGHPD